MFYLIALLVKLLREFAVWMEQMLQLIRQLGLQLIRQLGNWMLLPLIRALPTLGDALEELGRRSLAWSFLAPGVEEGAEVSALAAAEFGVGAIVIAGVAAIALAIWIFAPPILATVEAFRNEAANAAYMSNVQQEIFNRGGSYPGMPPDLGQNRPLEPAEQERWNTLYNLNAVPATSGGPDAGADDQAIDDYRALNDTNTQSLPSYNSGGNYSVQTPDGLDAAALQRQRLRAIQNGDLNGYNNSMPQSGQQFQKSGPNPSGFTPGQKK